VFDGPEDYHAASTIPKLGIDEQHMLFIRGVRPDRLSRRGRSREHAPPAYLLKKGIRSLPCIGDGRQSGTSGSPSILNASPEAADLNAGTVNVLISEEELEARRAALVAAGGYKYPASQTPWQEIQRAVVGQMNTGAILEGAEKYQRIAQTMGLPRDNH
jgi:dihydroxy-acid dehydratase